MLRQPLTLSLGEEEDDMCLQLFYTILLHAGKITCTCMHVYIHAVYAFVINVLFVSILLPIHVYAVHI